MNNSLNPYHILNIPSHPTAGCLQRNSEIEGRGEDVDGCWEELTPEQFEVALIFSDDSLRLAWWLCGAAIDGNGNPRFTLSSTKFGMMTKPSCVDMVRGVNLGNLSVTANIKFCGISIQCSWFHLRELADILRESKPSGEGEYWSWTDKTGFGRIKLSYKNPDKNGTYEFVGSLTDTELHILKFLIYADDATVDQEQAAKMMGVSRETVGVNISQGKLFSFTTEKGVSSGIPVGAITNWRNRRGMR